MPTPLQTSAAVRDVLNSVPNTRALQVVSASKPGVSISALDTLLGYGKVAGQTILDVFAPSDFNVPGTAPIARAVGGGVIKVTDAAASGVENVAGAAKKVAAGAAEGIQSGFKMATFVLIAIVGIWIWSVVKPR